MENRLSLHELLTGFLGSNKAYFQPPESLKMSYPCFRYVIENVASQYADNFPYKTNERYLVTYITRDADDPLPKQLCKEHGFSYERYYAADNLHHHVFVYTFY